MNRPLEKSLLLGGSYRRTTHELEACVHWAGQQGLPAIQVAGPLKSEACHFGRTEERHIGELTTIPLALAQGEFMK